MMPPLRCPHCRLDRRYASRFGDVQEDFGQRYEVVAGLPPGPCVLQIKCSECNRFSTIRERVPEEANHDPR